MSQAVNIFTELNTDSHPVNTKPNVMTDAINATLTTKGENQLILQNMEGNELITQLTPGFQPLGVKVFKDIAYIVSGRFDVNGVFIEGEIGTFPSPDWANLFAQPNIDPNFYLPLKNVYQPLKNFSTSFSEFILNDDINYTQSFRTNKLNFLSDRLIEVEIQPSYDESVNIIFTDDFNPVRLVNSRFRLSDNGKSAAIADRRQTKDTNTYSNKRFGATRLIRQADLIPDLTFNGVSYGGHHKGGGYRFYFKYVDSDGALTDIIEESRLVSMSYDDHGATNNENTGKLVTFTIGNLDKKFSGIKVYFSYASGDTDTTTSIYEIVNIFDIRDGNTVKIVIYGNEETLLIDRATLNLDYSSIDTVKTITQHDDSLLLGNVTNKTDIYDDLRLLAQRLEIQEIATDLQIKNVGSGYADPDNVYFKLGYWAGETVEIGIVFILKDGKGLTPVFPIRGGDNYTGTFNYVGGDILTSDGFIGLGAGVPQSENRLGAYRTWKQRRMLKGTNEDTAEIRFFQVGLFNIQSDPAIVDNTDGFFFVRKERKRDCIVQGYLTNTAKVPVIPKIADTGFYNVVSPASTWVDNYQHVQDIRYGIGKPNLPPNNNLYQLKIVPAPGRIAESTFHSFLMGGVKKGDPICMQGVVFPNPQFIADDNGDFIDMFYAFYAADMLADAPLMASMFNNSSKGIIIDDGPVEADQFIVNHTVATPGLSGNQHYVSAGANTPIKNLGLRNYTFNPVNLVDPTWLGGTNRKNYMQFIGTGQEAYSDDQFSSVEDRNVYYVGRLIGIGGIDEPWPGTGPQTDTLLSFEAAFFGVTNNQYSEYVGVRMTLFDPALCNHLRNDTIAVSNVNLRLPNGYGYTGYDLGDYTYAIQDRGVRLGVQANIYENENGALSAADWKNKYSNTSFSETYFAVTKRYSWSNMPSFSVVDIFDGDCYIGYNYKRVMSGLGIPGIPTAVDPTLYTDGNRETGLYPKGFVFPLVTENNYNVSLRTFEFKDAAEKILYGKNRTFYPLENIDALRASRQPESNGYNHGYDFDFSDRVYFSLNDRAPSLNINFGNRVLVSAPSVSGNFSNGYTDFSGLNFRDYNKQLGEITKLISHDNYVYCIFESGIGILPINQRTMVSQESGGVFIDDAQVLAEKMQIISNEYGSDQQFSIIKTDEFVYGCDLSKNKIWRIVNVGNGQHKLELISDFAIQAVLNYFKTRIYNNNFNIMVKANYDRERNNVIFSYLNEHNGRYITDLYEIIDVPEPVPAEPTGTTGVENAGPETLAPDPSLPATPSSPPATSATGSALIAKQKTQEQKEEYLRTRGEEVERGEEELRTPPFEEEERIPPITNNDGDNVEPSDFDEFGNRQSRLWEKNSIGSIYFNETINKWVSRLSWNPIWMFNCDSNLFSFDAINNREPIWKHFSENVPYCHFYGLQDNFVVEFILVDNASAQKVLNNLMIISNRAFPGRIEYQLLEGDVDYENFSTSDNGYTELLRQRHEPPASVGWTITTTTFPLGGPSFMNIQGISQEESERLVGGFVTFAGNIYIIGQSYDNGGVFYNEILDQDGNPIIGGLPVGWTFTSVDFGIIKQNMEYIEDHLYIEVGQDVGKSLIRDKAVRIRIIYEGYDYVTIQSIFSIFNYSFG
jgi:hypothetical protein